MAAFSYQNYHPLLHLDSIVLPNTPPSESFTQEMLANIDAGVLESSCIDHSSSTKVATFSDNEPSVTKKRSTESSTVVDRLETGEQVTQEVTPMDKKRKNRNGSSLSSAQSKDPREYKEKKQKKLDGAKKAEEKKFKSNKKDQVKVEEPPTGYIHVRARRGQATDSHSLAERVRREKISERMKMLQRLVPGCDKVTGRTVMLDEIINYVQSLQNQVEFLSLKLASVNPLFYDFGMDLDAALMVKQERLSSMESPFPSMPQCSPTLPTEFADTSTNNITTFPTSNNNYPFLDSSASLILQQGQRSSAFSQTHHFQNSESLLWDVEDQRQNFLSPSGFSNNLCSFN